LIEKLKLKIANNLNDKDFGEIFKGSIFAFAAKVFGVFLGFVLNLIISRYYGADGMGLYALVNTFLAILLVPALLGTSTSILRSVPEHIVNYSILSAFRLYKKMLGMVVVFSIVVSIAALTGANIIAESVFHHKNLAGIFAFSSLFLVFQAVTSLNISTIRALKIIKSFVFFQILGPIVNILILLLLTFLFFSEDNPVYSLLYTSVAVCMISIYAVRKSFQNQEYTQRAVKKINYKEIILTSFPMFLTSAVSIVLTQTDILMIGIYSTAEDVGIYAIAMKFALLTSFVLTSINTIVAPQFADFFHSGNLKSLEIIAKKSSKMIFYSTMPIIFVLIIFGKYVLSLFGEEFLAGYSVLLTLVVAQLVNSMAGSVGYLMNMSGYQKQYNYIITISAIVNIVLNMLLIPKYGIDGAAFASAASLVLWNVSALVYVKLKFGFYMGFLPFYSKGNE